MAAPGSRSPPPEALASADATEIRERAQPPLRGDEADQLLGFLDYHRTTLQSKAVGLDAAALDRSLAPTTMTLGGLLKHLSYVEDNWFSVFLHGNEPARPWRDADWRADPDREWHSAAADSPAQLRSLHEEALARSRDLVLEE